jgi:cytochrome c oxidase assembly factor CtaG
MTLLQRVIVAAVGGGIILTTFEMIRRRKLKEEYSLLWFLTGCVTLLFNVFPGILYWLSDLLQLHHLTAMLLVVFGFLLGIVLHYSTVISRLSEHEKELAQKLAILTWHLERSGIFENGAAPALGEPQPPGPNLNPQGRGRSQRAE